MELNSWEMTLLGVAAFSLLMIALGLAWIDATPSEGRRQD